MDKYVLSKMLTSSKPVNRESFIQDKCRQKKVLDLGCVRHNAEFALNDPNWMHLKIRSVAKDVLGVDYLEEDVRKLKAHGFNIIYGDVTKRLDIEGQFDVIVAGDLIEHLTNFDGFFENCSRLLAPGGSLIISTPNPFYAELFHFQSFKGTCLINPEHTCWIDPHALSQLSARFGYIIDETHYVKHAFKIRNFICETKECRFDILNSRWINDSIKMKIMRKLALYLFPVFYAPIKLLSGGHSGLVKYSDYIAVLRKAPTNA